MMDIIAVAPLFLAGVLACFIVVTTWYERKVSVLVVGVVIGAILAAYIPMMLCK